MAKIKLHGVCINSEAFKTAKSVKDAKLFAHLGSNAESAENELLTVLNIVEKKAKVKEVEIIAETEETEENGNTGA